MKATVIIPNYNGKHFLEPCLNSLSNQTKDHFEIIVVDDGSTDGSQEYIKEHFPLITLIALETNYGFSRAVNEGIKASITPYVILLNNDTTVHSDFVERMVRSIERSPKIFSVSAMMLQMDNRELIDSAGDLYTLIGWAVNRGSGRPQKYYRKRCRIFSACGGAAIYRRQIFNEIGFFDESFFAYLEDVDIGYRAKIFGYRNYYEPKAVVYHAGSGTSGSMHNPFKVKLTARNSIWVNYKNMPLIQLIINLLPLLIGYLVKILFFVKRGFAKEYLEGLKEGIITLKQCKKTPTKLKYFSNYLKIEGELIVNTFVYAIAWVKRKTSYLK
jgi:GT2 family glycosyltransferase